MVQKRSAGILLYRRHEALVEVLLVHPGGPFWSKKDEGAWFVPKGELEGDEEPLAAARREFREELGTEAPALEALSLGTVKNKSSKLIYAWALEGDLNTESVKSNTFELEWPPRSGRMQRFPEIDRAGWFGLDAAREKLLKGQLPFLDALALLVNAGRPGREAS